jgi:hypothetical protein
VWFLKRCFETLKLLVAELMAAADAAAIFYSCFLLCLFGDA